MINEVITDDIDEIVIVNGEAVTVPSIGLVDHLVYEDDEIDIEEKAIKLRHELIAYQRGQRDKAWAQRIVEMCSLMGWKIIFEPNCFTGIMEPDFVKVHNNKYVIKEFGCEYYHGHLVD